LHASEDFRVCFQHIYQIDVGGLNGINQATHYATPIGQI
jgi:hypothetical protein